MFVNCVKNGKCTSRTKAGNCANQLSGCEYKAAGGKSPKIKGDKFELEVCRLLNGDRTFWQPGQTPTPDIINVPYLGKGECKRRAAGFKRLYGWLADNDFLAVRDDRKPMLIVLKAQDLKLILDELDEIKKQAVVKMEGARHEMYQGL